MKSRRVCLLSKGLVGLAMLCFGFFCCAESLLPKSSDFLVGKEAFNAFPDEEALLPPTGLFFDKEDYTVSVGASKKITYTTQGPSNSGSINKAVRFWTSDSKVATVFWAGYGEAYITGLSSGTCTIFLESQANRELCAQASLQVHGVQEGDSQEIVSVSRFCATDQGLAYTQSLTAQRISNLKICCMGKTASGAIRDLKPRFSLSDTTILCDPYGNVTLQRGSIGKSYKIELFPTEESPIPFASASFTITIAAPQKYSAFLFSKYGALFFHYVLCFVGIGIILGMSFRLIEKSNQSFSLFASFALLAVFLGLGLLALQIFALQRPAALAYWFTSPTIVCLVSLLFTKRFQAWLTTITKKIAMWTRI